MSAPAHIARMKGGKAEPSSVIKQSPAQADSTSWTAAATAQCIIDLICDTRDILAHRKYGQFMIDIYPLWTRVSSH